MKTVVKIVQQ